MSEKLLTELRDKLAECVDLINGELYKPSEQKSKPEQQELHWMDTKNPKIKRISEDDAPEWLLKKAQEKKTNGLWYMAPSEGYEFGSVFKDTSKYNEAEVR